MEHAENYRDLKAYQECKSLALEIFEISKRFPKEERYSLTDQIRRSSRSVGAQIAEAWARRPHEKHFVSKLYDADGEQMETQHWINVSMDCSYLTEEASLGLLNRYARLGRMLQTMIDKASSFCNAPNKPDKNRKSDDDERKPSP